MCLLLESSPDSDNSESEEQGEVVEEIVQAPFVKVELETVEKV